MLMIRRHEQHFPRTEGEVHVRNDSVAYTGGWPRRGSLPGRRSYGLSANDAPWAPADATTFADWHGACKVRGIRLICASRPGYAASTRLAGRSVAHEDAGQLRQGDGPPVLAALHTAVIGIVVQRGETNLAHARRAFDFPVDRLLGRLSGEAASAPDVAHAGRSRRLRIDSFRIGWYTGDGSARWEGRGAGSPGLRSSHRW
jgi:hypothetical protein